MMLTPMPTSDGSLPPTTTYEEDLKSYARRRINFMWETTQAIIAVVIVIANIAAVFILVDGSSELLANAFFLIVGFYFGRTNHARPSV